MCELGRCALGCHTTGIARSQVKGGPAWYMLVVIGPCAPAGRCTQTLCVATLQVVAPHRAGVRKEHVHSHCRLRMLPSVCSVYMEQQGALYG